MRSHRLARIISTLLAATSLTLGFGLSVASAAHPASANTARSSAVQPTAASKSTRTCRVDLARYVTRGWQIECRAGASQTLRADRRVVKVSLEAYRRDPARLRLQARATTRALDAAAAQKVAADRAAAARAQLIAACPASIGGALPSGWSASCSTLVGTTTADLATGRVVVAANAYATDPRGTTADVVNRIGGLALPTRFTAAQKACQQRVDAFVAPRAGWTATRWIARCMDVSEMPTLPAHKAAGIVTGGMAYWGRPVGGLILVSAGETPSWQISLTAHEFGHALANEIPTAQRADLAKRFGALWHSDTDAFGTIHEAIAQSFAECSGASVVRPEYVGLHCSTLRRILDDAHVQHDVRPGILIPGAMAGKRLLG